MTTVQISVSQIMHIMDFISDVSTLYEVKPGPEFQLLAGNAKAQLTGAAPPTLYGHLMSEFLPKTFYRNTLLPIFKQVMISKETFRGEHITPYPGGPRDMGTLITPVLDEHGQCTHIWVVTKHQRTEKDLEYLSSTDELTGVSNRRFFLERLLKSFTRYTEQDIEFCVMLVDLDHFKAINDTNGHSFGDRLLQQIAKRMSSCVRENDVLGRFGGDEFMILTEGPGSHETACDIAKRIIGKTKEPFKIGEKQLFVSTSIGIARIGDQKDIERILADADVAMYQAKSFGGARYVVSGH